MTAKPWDRLEWLDDSRRLLVESAAGIIGKSWSFEQLGAVEASPGAWSSETWRSLGAAGMIGLADQEDGSHLDAALVSIECGRALCVVPAIESALVLALLSHSDGDLAADLADAVLAGEAVVAPMYGMVSAGDGVVTAADPVVAFGATANYLLVRSPAALNLVEHSPDVQRDSVPALGPTPVAGIAFADRPVISLEFDDLDQAWHRAVVTASFARAALAVGGCMGALETAIHYVNERHQFGVPIGSFQAVQHQLADAALATELARTTLLRSARSDREPLDADLVWEAQRLANAAYLQVGRTACQVRGGYGFSVEFDGQAHLRMAKTQSVLADQSQIPDIDELARIRADATAVPF